MHSRAIVSMLSSGPDPGRQMVARPLPIGRTNTIRKRKSTTSLDS